MRGLDLCGLSEEQCIFGRGSLRAQSLDGFSSMSLGMSLKNHYNVWANDSVFKLHFYWCFMWIGAYIGRDSFVFRSRVIHAV